MNNIELYFEQAMYNSHLNYIGITLNNDKVINAIKKCPSVITLISKHTGNKKQFKFVNCITCWSGCTKLRYYNRHMKVNLYITFD